MSSQDLATRQLRLYPKVEDARDGAMDDATATGGRVFPCIVFNQRAVLERRSAAVEALFARPAGAGVVEI